MSEKWIFPEKFMKIPIETEKTILSNDEVRISDR